MTLCGLVAGAFAVSFVASNSDVTDTLSSRAVLVLRSVAQESSRPPVVFDSLPEVEPSREWLGAEYADTLIAKFRLAYPSITLVVDPSDLEIYDPHFQKPVTESEIVRARPGYKEPNWLERIKERARVWWRNYEHVTLRERVISTAQKLMGPKLKKFFRALEFGAELNLAGGEKESKAQQLKLREWIMAQPDKSLYPDDLMIEALRQHDGRVIAAWATAWNVMRDGWEYAASRNWGELHQKFRSVTGERHLWNGGARYIVLAPEERVEAKVRAQIRVDGSDHFETLTLKPSVRMVVTKRGDEFSTIYHRLGVELLAMVTGAQTGSSRLGWALGSTGAWGEYLKYNQTAGLARENKKRIQNDLNSAISGARILTWVQSGEMPDVKTPVAGNYLRANNALFGADYQITDGRPAAYFGSKADAQFWAAAMSPEELRIRLEHHQNYDRKSLDRMVLKTSGDYDRYVRGLKNYLAAGANDPQLNEVLKSEDARDGLHRQPLKPDVTRDLALGERGNADNMGLAHKSNPFQELWHETYKLTQEILKKIEQNEKDARIRPAVAQIIPRTKLGGAGRCELIHAN